jgi:enoyl-CoA hydratase/carnithine racemase
MSNDIVVEKRGHILLIGLNRPEKLNAFTPNLLRELAAAYTQLAEDPDLRCGVLWAQGTDFTAGLDMPAIVQEIPKAIFKPFIPRGMIDPFGVSTAPCPKPIVTAVQGRCYTLGIELMLVNQISIASADAKFSQYEVSRGLFPFGGGTVRWPQSVGVNNAYRYMLTGDWFDAQEAYRLGLVQEIVPEGQQLERAIALAEKIAEQAPLGVQAVLRSTRLAQSKGSEAALGKIQRQILRIFLSKDVRRGIAAFKARTTAKFKGD